MLGLVSIPSTPGRASRVLGVRFGAPVNRLDAGDPAASMLAIPYFGSVCSENLPPVPDDLFVGAEFVELGQGLDRLEAATDGVYRRILAQASVGNLCRVWNYVPRINETTAGLEHYRAFCRGRASAFETQWGAGFTRRLPAASAVGGPADLLAVLYAVSPSAAEPIENPEQVPAYEYPPEHGPRSPSFCRATRTTGRTHDWVFVSGTAAIKGHRTIAPGTLLPQVATTLDNLRLVSEACDLGPNLGLHQGWHRAFKVYLRRPQDWAEACAALRGTLFQPADQVIWLQADICRAELEIEIEATLWRAR